MKTILNPSPTLCFLKVFTSILILLLGIPLITFAQDEKVKQTTSCETTASPNEGNGMECEEIEEVPVERTEKLEVQNDNEKSAVSTTDFSPLTNAQQYLIPTEPEVSEVDGSLVYRYPLTFPMGKHGLTPQISFIYNSSYLDFHSLLSRGWSIDIPKIERINKTGTNHLYATEYFRSSLDGELINQGNGIYTPRVENGAFNKYEFQNDVWTVTDKTGVRYVFGETSQSRDDDPNDPMRIYGWYLETVTDILGTTITYSYHKEMGQIYPDAITYNQEGDFVIQFHREDVSGTPHKSYRKAFRTVTQYRVDVISVTAMGEILMEYDLIYDNNDFLEKICLTGYAEGQSESLPATEFEYDTYSSGQVLFQEHVDWASFSPSNIFNSAHITNSKYHGVRYGDIDGDGYLDAVAAFYHYVYPTIELYQKAYIFNESSGVFEESAQWTNALPPSLYFVDFIGGSISHYRAYLLDFNGDGLVDVIPESGEVYLNNGTTWVATNIISGMNNPRKFEDVNLDGCLDGIYFNNWASPQVRNIYFGNGVSQPEVDSQYADNIPAYFGFTPINVNSNAYNYITDANGDGIPDLADGFDYQPQEPEMSTRIYFGTGEGWESSYESVALTLPDSVVNPPHPYVVLNGRRPSQFGRYSQLIDVNGDGYTDCVLIGRLSSEYNYQLFSYVLIGSPEGYVYDEAYSTAIPDDGLLFGGSDTPYESEASNLGILQFLDINGDGLVDILEYPTNPSGDLGIDVHINKSPTNLLTNITSPQGGTTQINYSPAIQADQNWKGNIKLMVVTSVTTDDQNFNTTTTSYQYDGGSFYYNTPHDKRFAGFKSIEKYRLSFDFESDLFTTTYFHQANGSTGDESVDNDYGLIGKPWKTTSSSVYGTLSETYTHYEVNDLGNGAQSVQVASVLSKDYEGVSHVASAIEYDYDSYGNTREIRELGIVAGNSDGSYIDLLTDRRTTVLTYTNDVSNYIVGLPKKNELLDYNGNRVAKSNSVYYSNGQLKETQNWIEGSSNARTQYEYYSDGNLKKMKDPLGNATIYHWDVTGRHIEQIIYPNTLHDYFAHDPKRGLLIEERQNNGMHKTYDYDPLGRPITIKQALASTTLHTTHEYSYNTATFPHSMAEVRYRTWNETDNTVSYYDGLGRTIQTKKERTNGWQTVSTIYDDLGRIVGQSVPYASANHTYEAVIYPSPDYWITTEYDARDRLLEVTTSLGVTNYSYHHPFITRTTNALGKSVEHHLDVYGNLTKVIEENDGNNYITQYVYTTNNLLEKLVDAEGNMREWTYDGLGRMTSVEDLHFFTNSNPHTYTFEYDKRDLIGKTLPDGVSMSYEYDEVGNLIRETTPEGVTTYVYGGCNRGRGRLCRIDTPHMKKRFQYRFDGLPSRENVIIDGQGYLTIMEYNRGGEVKKITHPNGDVVTFETTFGGLFETVKYNGMPLTAAMYDSNDQLNSLAHSNGIVSTITYNPSQGFLPISKETITSDGVKLQDFSYQYDSLGQMTVLSEWGASTTNKHQMFQYDDLGRLIEVNTANTVNNGDYVRSYEYSPTGNILTFNGISYTYNGTHPQAVSQIGSTLLSYDNRGNLLSDGVWTHTWDSKGRLTNSTDGTTTSSYVYDNQKSRIKLIENGNTTIYPTASYEEKNGIPKLSISLGNILVATIEDGTILHIHTDHLGGTHLTTDESGNSTQELDYFPFGETRVDLGTNIETKQFTGYIKDTSTGLSYAQARYYQSNTGKFISQDPVAQFSPQQVMIDPQQLNHYSYARNNPVKWVDPSGEVIKVWGDDLFKQKAMRDLRTLSPGLRYSDNGSTIERISNYTADGSKTPYGDRLMNDLMASETLFKVHKYLDEPANGNFTPGDEAHTIKYKPNAHISLKALNEKNFKTYSFDTPSFIILGHELFHAWDYDEGGYDRSRSMYRSLNGTLYRARNNEIRAVGLLELDEPNENMLRAEHGLPLRDHYDGSTIIPFSKHKNQRNKSLDLYKNARRKS